MDPVSILDLVLMRHLYDAAAEIEEVVAKHPCKSPTLKIEMLDRIIPSVGLLGGIALEHVEELGCPGLPVGLEEPEMIQGGVQAFTETGVGIGMTTFMRSLLGPLCDDLIVGIVVWGVGESLEPSPALTRLFGCHGKFMIGHRSDAAVDIPAVNTDGGQIVVV